MPTKTPFAHIPGVREFYDFGHTSDLDVNGDRFNEDHTVYELIEYDHDYEIYINDRDSHWIKIFGCNEAGGVGQDIALGHCDRLPNGYHPFNNPSGIYYRLYNHGHLI